MQTRMEFSAGMYIRGALRINTVESGGKKQGRAEGSIKLDHWPENLSWPHESLEWRWPSRFVLTRPLARLSYLYLDGSWHPGCPHRGWWFKVTHWQHFQQLDSESLKSGQHVSMCSHGMCNSSRGRWWRCTVRETLDDWCVSQNDDSVILITTLCSKKWRTRSM